MEQIHSKEIRSIAFHPGSLIENEISINYSNWLASSSKSGQIAISECSNFLISNSMEENNLSSNTWFLQGHSACVTNIQWNPHNPNQLLSASYDGTLELWDTRKNICKPICNFQGHFGRVFSCCFSLLHPDIIFSASDDHTCRMWSISNQTIAEPPKKDILSIPTITNNNKTKKKRKKRKTSKNSSIHEISNENSTLIPENNNISDHQQDIQIPKQQTSKITSNIVKKSQTLFPSLNNLNKTKEQAANECLTIARNLININDNEINNNNVLNKEIQNLTQENEITLASVLKIWKGDIMEAYENIFQPISESNARTISEKQKSTFLSISPQFGFTIWKELIKKQAKEKEENGDYHISSLFYLSIGEVMEAIQVYKNARLYQDAIMLAKIQLGKDHEIIIELYESFASFYLKQGKNELAAQCFLQISSPKKAINCLQNGNVTDSKNKIFSSLDIKNLEIAKEISKIYSLEDNYKEISEKLGYLFVITNDAYKAKENFVLLNDYSNLFISSVLFSLLNLSSNTFALSRAQSKQQQEALKLNNFKDLFPNITNNKKQTNFYDLNLLFFEKIWSFLNDIQYFSGKTLSINELSNMSDNLSNFIKDENLISNISFQFDEKQTYLALNLFSQCILQFYSLEYTYFNKNLQFDKSYLYNHDFIKNWLFAFQIYYNLHDFNQMKSFIDVFGFYLSLDDDYDLNHCNNDTFLIDHVHAFCFSFTLEEYLKNNDGDHFMYSSEELVVIERLLLPSCLLIWEDIEKQIDLLQQQIQTAILHDSFSDISRKQTGKRKKDEFKFDVSDISSVTEEEVSIESLKENIEKLNLQKENMLHNNIVKYPYPNSVRSKALLKKIKIQL